MSMNSLENEKFGNVLGGLKFEFRALAGTALCLFFQGYIRRLSTPLGQTIGGSSSDNPVSYL